MFMRVPLAMAYEQPPSHAVEAVVFFQGRVWEGTRHGRDIEAEVNQPRVELVRALQKELGTKFVGGLTPNEYACRKFPDLVSKVSARREEFIRAAKHALVGIASQPCISTGSFKLAEYLAASKCIVSPPMTNRLPAPLIDGVNFLGYLKPLECVEQCVRLLENRGFAEDMRCDNWEYYRREVEPAAHVYKLLRECAHYSA
jgi:hypothetical protein